MAMKFIPPYTMFSYNLLSLIYALASFVCIYLGSIFCGWSASKKQKAAIAIYITMVFSAFYLASDQYFQFLPNILHIALVILVFLTPLAAIFVVPVLLGLSHKNMAAKNNWLLYLLAWGPIFDFAAKVASI